MKENILIIAAHSDDQIIGVGGTAAKYAQEGFNVTTIIVTQGEISHPHFQEKIISKKREQESIRANKIIGGKEVLFLGLLEKDVNKEKEVKKTSDKLKNIIKKLKPIKIFVHEPNDPHPLHKKVSNLTIKIVHELKTKTELFGFDVWSPLKLNKKKYPTLVVDISTTFDKKIKALKCFKSQFNLLGFINFFALTSMYIKNFINGRKHDSKYAEIFYRLK